MNDHWSVTCRRQVRRNDATPEWDNPERRVQMKFIDPMMRHRFIRAMLLIAVTQPHACLPSDVVSKR